MRRDRLVVPATVHDAVLRDDLTVPTIADLERDRRERDRHDEERRPAPVVGRVPAGFDGLDEAFRVLNNAGVIDDRTTRSGGASRGDAPTVTALGPAGVGAIASIDPASTDRAGRITLETGSAPYAGYALRLDFAVELDDEHYAVVLQAADADAAAASVLVDVDYTDLTAVRWQLRTSAALTAATLSWHYVVRRFDE